MADGSNKKPCDIELVLHPSEKILAADGVQELSLFR
jgi:hypothetical protein